MNKEQIKKILDKLAQHESRIEALEDKQTAVVSKKITNKGTYSGATGGARYLIAQKFFKEQRELPAVREQLRQKGYHYSRQAVHQALNILSKSSGPLVSLKEGKRKVYVERK